MFNTPLAGKSFSAVAIASRLFEQLNICENLKLPVFFLVFFLDLFN